VPTNPHQHNPEPIDTASLTGARWFAGKGQVLTEVTRVDAVALPDAEGALVELVDAVFAEGGRERYALPLREGAECNGYDPLWPALARAAGVSAQNATGFLAEDLSNTVVILDGRAVLKLYRRPEVGAHPEVEALRALEGSPHVPQLLGSFDRNGATIVAVQDLVAGEPVGWESLIRRLEQGDPATGEAAELATVTATLHLALAARLGVSHAHLAPPLVVLQGELAPLAARVEAELATLLDVGSVEVQRIHGDLHVAQFLRTKAGLVVVDWEGEPAQPLAVRGRHRPALHDLGSLRLSLAHAARAAHRRNPGFDWRAWSEQARAEALGAYEALVPGLDRDLLHALEVEKELTELAYAARWLPEWLYAPTAVLPFILETP
jgi:maltokinase